MHVNKDLSIMNKDQVKGVAKIVAGKVQEEAGNLIGSPEQVVRGVTRQVAGKAQKGRGDVKEIIEDFKEDHPK
jgi:uncharacterized protein YjbJ (UPF0337 family)